MTMAKQAAPGTTMRKLMESVVAEHGKDSKDFIMIEERTRVLIMCRNPFDYGYIRIILATGEVWVAGFSADQSKIRKPYKLQINWS